MCSLLLGATVAAVFICDCLCSKSRKNIREQISRLSVSGLFFIKRHPTKYMHIEKNLTKKHHYTVKPMSNLRAIFFAADFWLHDFA